MLLATFGPSVTVLGLAFKPDTDDVRESPAIPIVQRLAAPRSAGHDPRPSGGGPPRRASAAGSFLSDDLEKALREADVVVLVTRWAQYLEVPTLLAALNPQVPFVDGRRLLEKESVANYFGIGAG